MIKCSRCHTDNSDSARFCSGCGLSFSTPALLAPGDVVQARYRVVTVIGHGGMGAVYLVEDQKLFGRRWALKEMLDCFTDPADRAQALQLFEREARILVALSHPNLPQITDYFAEQGRQYLVMQYIDGQTLDSVLKAAKGSVPEAQVMAWALQLCDVLIYLHGQKPAVIFRDLKPANVMVDAKSAVKLIDFGIARLFDPSKKTDTLKIGTVGYAPPEQYAGGGQTDARTDIYALGAMLHHLLTGRDPSAHPFVFPACRALNKAVSAGMDAAVGRALELDPAKRFQSIAEMKKMLTAPPSVAAGPPPPARPVGAASSSALPWAPGPGLTCPRCQMQLRPGARVCFNCGYVLGPSSGPQAATTAQRSIAELVPVQWAQKAAMPTFRAYCARDRRETTWFHESSKSCSCAECGLSWTTGALRFMLVGYCGRCRTRTNWAISDTGCTCLGCGQVRKASGAHRFFEAGCSKCGAPTTWIVNVDACTCLGCGRTRYARHIEAVIEASCDKCKETTLWIVHENVDYLFGRRSVGGTKGRICLSCGKEK